MNSLNSCYKYSKMNLHGSVFRICNSINVFFYDFKLIGNEYIYFFFTGKTSWNISIYLVNSKLIKMNLNDLLFNRNEF